jgi:hypothetical protein
MHVVFGFLGTGMEREEWGAWRICAEPAPDVDCVSDLDAIADVEIIDPARFGECLLAAAFVGAILSALPVDAVRLGGGVEHSMFVLIHHGPRPLHDWHCVVVADAERAAGEPDGRPVAVGELADGGAVELVVSLTDVLGVPKRGAFVLW